MLDPDDLVVETAGALRPSRFVLERDGRVLGGTGTVPPIVPSVGFSTYIGTQPSFSTSAVRIAGPGVVVQDEGVERTLTLELANVPYINGVARLAVTSGAATNGTFELIDPSGVRSSTGICVPFPAGIQSVTVRYILTPNANTGWASEDVTVALVNHAGECNGVGGTSLLNLLPDAAWGPSSVTLRFNEVVVSPPVTGTWEWADGAARSVSETAGVVSMQIVSEATYAEDKQVRVTVAPGVGAPVNGTHYVYPPPGQSDVWTLPAGSRVLTASLVMIDDPGLAVSPARTLVVTGESLSAGLTDPTPPADTLTLTIIDNDITPPTERLVQWSSPAVIVQELLAADTEIELRLITNVPFNVSTDVVVSVTENNAIANSDYRIIWPDSENRMRFAPGATSSAIRLRVLAGGATQGVNSQVILTAIDGSEFNLGDNDVLTVTIRDVSGGTVEPTRLMVKRGLRDGRTIVEGLAAVLPPSTVLPRYQIDGEDCQVIGHSRNDLGEWDSCWVVGVAGNDAAAGAPSYPDVAAGQLVLEPGVGTTVPAESGNYPSVDFSAMKFVLGLANVATPFERTLAENLAGVTTVDDQVQWEGPSGALWPQVGPDLRRTFYYRLWLKAPSDSTPDSASPPPNTRCCLVELWMTYYVDIDAVVCEGRLSNSAAIHSANPRETNPAASGNVNFTRFAMENVPAGWAVRFGPQNSMEFFSGSTATLVPTRAQNYLMKPTAQMPFRFALYNTSTVTSAEALRVLEYRRTFTAVGEYGPTRQGIFGPSGDLLMDHGRLGMPHGLGGWRGAEQLAVQRRDLAVTAWGNGSEQYPIRQRRGWMQTVGDPRYDTPGGGHIEGSWALFPSAAWWETGWIMMAAEAMRTRIDCQDPITGDNDWGWIRAFHYGNNRTPFAGSGEDRFGFYRHPWMNTDSITEFEILNMSLGDWVFAPTSRPWNTPTAADPDAVFLDHEIKQTNAVHQHDMGHASRAVPHLRDAWWGMRSPLAWRQIQMYGAFATRVFSIHEWDGVGVNGFLQAFNDLGWIQRNLAQNVVGFGAWRSGNRWGGPPQVRAWAWGIYLASMAAATASNRTRDGFMPSTISDNWFAAVASLTRQAITTIGSFSTSSGNDNPNPYDTQAFGAPDIPNRTGALPNGSGGPGAPFYGYGPLFHHLFLIQAGYAAARVGLQRFPTLRAAFDFNQMLPWNVMVASQAAGAAPGTNSFPSYTVITTGSAPVPAFPADQPPIASQFRTGINHWRFPNQPDQSKKVGMCVYRYRATRNPEDLEPLLVALNLAGWPLEQALPFLYSTGGFGRAFVPIVTETSYRTYFPTGDHTFWIQWLAEVSNLLS